MTWHSPRPFLSFSSQDKSWCESIKRSSHNFMENKSTPKNYLSIQEPDLRCLGGPGFREISSRENDKWNLDVCKYFSLWGKALVAKKYAFSPLHTVDTTRQCCAVLCQQNKTSRKTWKTTHLFLIIRTTLLLSPLDIILFITCTQQPGYKKEKLDTKPTKQTVCSHD